MFKLRGKTSKIIQQIKYKTPNLYILIGETSTKTLSWILKMVHQSYLYQFYEPHNTITIVNIVKEVEL